VLNEDSKVSKKILKIGVFSHDGGGANQLAHFCKKDEFISKQKLFFVASGPAKEIFKRIFSKSKIHSNYNRSLKNFNLILCSNSCNEFEKKIMNESINKLKIPTWVMFDHWVRYEERLNYKEKLLKPEKILVTDLMAERTARDIYSEIKIENVKNHYLEFIKKRISYKKSKKKKVVFFTEPENVDSKRIFKKKQESVLRTEVDYILKNKKIKRLESFNLIIRLHPSFGSFELPFDSKNIIVEQQTVPIEKSLSNCDISIGKTSYALYLSSMLKIPTFSIAKSLYNREHDYFKNKIKNL
jgi:hypothetical protein